MADKHGRSWVGLSGPFTRTAPGCCERCGRETQASWPWPGWRRLRSFWLGVIALLVAASPLYLADMHGMLPAAMVLVFAIGPLNSLAGVRPTCLECGAVVEPVRAQPLWAADSAAMGCESRASE